MSDATLESRVSNLEQQVTELMCRVLAPSSNKAWRSTIGMFDGDSLMREIDEEGRKIRAAERDHS